MISKELNVLPLKTGELRLEITLAVQPEAMMVKLASLSVCGKPLDIEIKQHRKKRSLNSNAYLWQMLQKMAEKLNTTKDELYIEVLERYGQFEHMIVTPMAAEALKERYKVVKELDTVHVNDKESVHMLFFYGSSTYNTAEMTVLINGVVEEAKALDIETMTPDKIAQMLAQTGA